MGIPFTLASVYCGPLDYDITHVIQGLNRGGVLDNLFTYFTFTGSIVFMALVIAALLIGGARKETVAFAFTLAVVNVLSLGLKYTVARLARAT
jgi:hypothetical protein